MANALWLIARLGKRVVILLSEALWKFAHSGSLADTFNLLEATRNEIILRMNLLGDWLMRVDKCRVDAAGAMG